MIVDEFTGRVLEGRRYSEGLHQAIEAKEGVAIKEENQTLATITLQNYFRMYDKLAGMTGTAVTEEGEFVEIYGLEVVVIPTNRPIARVDQPDLVYVDEEYKFAAVADDIEERHKAGQPILIGTVSIEKSERLASHPQEARHGLRGAQRQAARAGGGDHRPGRDAGSHHRRHQHGGAWCGHPARREPRGDGEGRAQQARHRA